MATEISAELPPQQAHFEAPKEKKGSRIPKLRSLRYLIPKVRHPGADDSDQRQDEPTGPDMSRRSFLGKTAKAAAFVGAVSLLGNGYIDNVTVKPAVDRAEANAEYLSDRQPIEFIFGNHLLSTSDMLHQYQTKGGLDHNWWNAEAVSKFIDSMKAAKNAGKKSFFAMIDSVSSIPGGAYTADTLQDLNLTKIPHGADFPESLRDEVPENFYVLGGDIFGNQFGLSGIGGLAPHEQDNVYKLADDLNNRYAEPSPMGMFVDTLKVLPGALAEKLAEGTLTVGLLTAAIAHSPEEVRQKLRKYIPRVAGWELVKGLSQADLESALTGLMPNMDAQKASTIVGNITDWSIGDKPIMTSTKARTALLYEKAQNVIDDPAHIVDDNASYSSSEKLGMHITGGERPDIHPFSTITDNPPDQVDIVLGSFHQADAPQIEASQQTRFALIADYLQDALGFASQQIDSTYTNLSEHKENILRAIAQSIVDTRIFQINLPWGKQELPAAEVESFEQLMVLPVAHYRSKSLVGLVEQQLDTFGIKPDWDLTIT